MWQRGKTLARRPLRARPAVEGLEGRSLLSAAAAAVDPRQVLALREQAVVRGIEAEKVAGQVALRQVLAVGQSSTDALEARLTKIRAAEQAHREQGDVMAVKLDRVAATRASWGLKVIARQMWDAVSLDRHVDGELTNNQARAAGYLEQATQNLDRGGNPAPIVSHTLTALDTVALSSRQRSDLRLSLMSAFRTSILAINNGGKGP